MKQPQRRSGRERPLLASVLFTAIALPCAGQTLYDEYRPYIEQQEGTARIFEREAPATEAPRIFGLTSDEEWAGLIDETWGPGSDDFLDFFDQLWTAIDERYGAFYNLDVDLDEIRDRYRPEIAAGVSRGRFAAILNQFSLALKDAHTFFIDRLVNWGTDPAPGVPLFAIGAWTDNSRFGAALTPLPDDTLLVFRALPDQVLGLEPGDIVLGYDGVPWKELYRQLLDAELPVHLGWVCGSADASMEHCLMMSAGLNWHLFDTIDIVKYRTGETVHLPTADLRYQSGRIWGNEQIPVPGVPMPDFWNEDYITWGIVEGTLIGYIYVASWSPEPELQISRKFYDAVHSLMFDHETAGLILDFRYNTGGYMLMAHSGYTLLFNERIAAVAFDVRGDPDDHYDMVPHPTFTSRLFTIPGNPDTYYDRPIAVLTGPGAVSNGDWETLRMGFHPMVRTFGKPSNGAFTPSDTGDVGPEYWISGATGSGYLVDGHRYLCHTGAPVDVEVWLTPSDAARGVDTVVQAAITWIQGVPRRPSALRRASSSSPAGLQGLRDLLVTHDGYDLLIHEVAPR